MAHGGYSLSEVAEEHRDAEYLAKTYGYDQIEELDAGQLRDIVKTSALSRRYPGQGRWAPASAALCSGSGTAPQKRQALQIYERSEVHHIAKGTRGRGPHRQGAR